MGKIGKKKENLPLIARVNLKEEMEKREEELKDREVSILASADYTERIPKIRLFYVSYGKFKRYGTKEVRVGGTYRITNSYIIPNGMSLADACKVVSYLSDKVEDKNELGPISAECVVKIGKELEKYGFERVESAQSGEYHTVSEYSAFRKIGIGDKLCGRIEGVTDLFTVGGDYRLFNHSVLAKRYFNWYNKNVTKEDMKNIYKNCNKEHLIPNDSEEGQEM